MLDGVLVGVVDVDGTMDGVLEGLPGTDGKIDGVDEGNLGTLGLIVGDTVGDDVGISVLMQRGRSSCSERRLWL
jgi:hypothetical protein